jgi:hypothetical protein
MDRDRIDWSQKFPESMWQAEELASTLSPCEIQKTTKIPCKYQMKMFHAEATFVRMLGDGVELALRLQPRGLQAEFEI